MTDVVKEGLSACLDGELPQGELDLLLKRVARDAELRDTVGRYALIGESLRAERPAVASRDFASKIMAALDDEPALAPVQDGAQPAAASIPVVPSVAANARTATRFSPALVRYLRPAAGMAIAAGVAAIAVLSLQQPEPGQQSVPNLVAANDSSGTTSSANGDDGLSYVVPTSTAPASFVPAARLTNYVVAHSEYSSPLGRRSMLTGVLADDEEEAAGVTVTGADEAANGSADADAGVQEAVQER